MSLDRAGNLKGIKESVVSDWPTKPLFVTKGVGAGGKFKWNQGRGSSSSGAVFVLVKGTAQWEKRPPPHEVSRTGRNRLISEK